MSIFGKKNARFRQVLLIGDVISVAMVQRFASRGPQFDLSYAMVVGQPPLLGVSCNDCSTALGKISSVV
uniref:Uncharacterized protein n=1 Tax=Pararge aegeria TaxID=116150 RepID=S4PV74_9NEOP